MSCGAWPVSARCAYTIYGSALAVEDGVISLLYSTITPFNARPYLFRTLFVIHTEKETSCVDRDDALLVQRAQSGDQDALVEIYRRFQPSIYLDNVTLDKRSTRVRRPVRHILGEWAETRQLCPDMAR